MITDQDLLQLPMSISCAKCGFQMFVECRGDTTMLIKGELEVSHPKAWSDAEKCKNEGKRFRLSADSFRLKAEEIDAPANG